MRIHSDILTERDIRNAQTYGGMVGVVVTKCDAGGSRSRKRRFDVLLEGNSKHFPGASTLKGGHAATWDEWGIFIDALFRIDADAIIGQYRGYDLFRDVTYQRYDNLRAEDVTHEHTWASTGDGVSNTCKVCGIQFNWYDVRH